MNINIVAADTKDFDRLLHERRSQIKSIIMEAMAHHNDMRSAIRGLVR